MPRYCLIALFFIVSCGQKTETTTDSQVDSLSENAVVDSMQAVLNEIAATPEMQEDKWESMQYEPEIFISERRDSTYFFLVSNEISVKDTTNSVDVLEFGDSRIDFVTYEPNQGGVQVICKAEITNDGFPLKGGLVTGMPRSECLKLLDLKEESITKEGSKEFFGHQWINGSGDYGYVEFRFSADKFIGLTYRDPCADPNPGD